MAEIPILGIPSTWRVPGPYAEILFAQGPATAAAGQRDIIVVAPKLTGSGTWTANTVYEVTNEQTAIDGAGAGSPLHRALRRILKTNKITKLWALPYAETSGGAPAKADLTVTWTDDPTATGVTGVEICGEEITVAFTDASTVTTIATAMKAAINDRSHLPVTADNAAGVLTLEAKINGISQGDGTTGAIRVRAFIDAGKTTSVATENGGTTDALGLGTGTTGAEGSTTEAANLATALATINAARYYYIVTTCWDATSLGNLQTHISNKSEPNPGLRSVGIAGYQGTLANAQTLATARNYERLQIAWQPNSWADPAELAANVASIRQKRESVLAAHNFDSYRNASDWLVPPAYSQADWPTQTNQNDAITDGLTPIASDQVGSYIVMSISTRSKNSAGTQDDFRAAETHRVSVADLYMDTVLVNYALNYENKRLKDDQYLSDGSVNPNQKLVPGVITPSLFKPFIRGFIDDFADKGLIQNEDASKEGLRCVVDPNNAGRLETGHDLHVIDLLHQATFRLAEVSSG